MLPSFFYRNNLSISKSAVYLILLLVFIRTVYVLYEIQYHVSILDLVANPNLGKQHVDYLTDYGHNLAAFGITLSIILFLYKLSALKFFGAYRWVVFLAILGSSFYGFKYAFGKSVDLIVESNYDKAYEAYYINIFRYGILTGEFKYSGFLNNDKFPTNRIGVEDRLILANTFFLTHLDSSLVDRTLEVGIQRFSHLYVRRNDEDYQHARSLLQELHRELRASYQALDDARQSLNKELITAAAGRSSAYEKLMNELESKWSSYQDAHSRTRTALAQNLSDSKLDEVERNLVRYFNYRNNSRAEREYRDAMQKSFSRYITPETWCASGRCPDRTRISNVIRNEIVGKLEKSVFPLPINLDRNDFFYHSHVLGEVGRKFDMNLMKDFQYTENQVLKLYDESVQKKRSLAISAIEKRFESEGSFNISASWDDFVSAPFVRKRIKSAFPEMTRSEISLVTQMINSGKYSDFRTRVYIPMVEKKIKSIIYSRSDFIERSDLRDIGLDAVRFLYMPAFALILSFVAIIFNVAGILYWLVFLFSRAMSGFVTPNFLFKDQSSRISVRRVFYYFFMFASFVYIGVSLSLLQSEYVSDSTLMWLMDAAELAEGWTWFYLKFLEWSVFYENMIYTFRK